MKILFAGPSLHGSTQPIPTSVATCGPARQGDIVDAVKSGADVIGLVDGRFEDGPSVWHKEILFALAQGVTVMGAASMGALRAAECESYGMIGVGRIFERYRDGVLVDDADVALVHAPRELGYLPISLSVVDVCETLTALCDRDLLSRQECERLNLAARGIFFKDRTWCRVVEASGLEPDRAKETLAALRAGAVNLKRQDAEELVILLAKAADRRGVPPSKWTLSHTTYFEQSIAPRR